MAAERQPLKPHVLGVATALLDRLLRLQLFYKVLIANSLLVALGVLFGTMFSLRFGGRFDGDGSGFAFFFSVLGVVLTVILNIVILRAALQPLRTLHQSVEAMGQGDLGVRVPASPLADTDLAGVSSMLNQMLDHVQRYEVRLQDLSASVLNAQEGERQRIARELHDQIGQSLTLLLVRLKITEAAPQAETMRAELADLRTGVAATIDQVRRLALDLRPPALDQLGLVPALRELTREFSDRTRIAIVFEPPTEAIELAPERATAIYRIVQEALTNIAKHADAHTAHVAMEIQGQAVQVTITDDGCGFDPTTLRTLAPTTEQRVGAGLGLFGMEERARLLGGNLKIATRPGSGTTIVALIPKNLLETNHGTTDLDFFAHSQPSSLDLAGR